MIKTEINYNTRDAKGNDFVKKVKIKEYPIVKTDFICPICKKQHDKGSNIKKIVSSKFTDWVYVDDYICEKCSRLFSLYFYSYIVNDEEIKIINIREIKKELLTRQKTPFKFCITTTGKKHLFYRSVTNKGSDNFAVNLETETIYTTCERMKELFEFVENLQTLGVSKEEMSKGNINFNVLKKVGIRALDKLRSELRKSREIQIPLYCGQKLEITEDEALCNMDLILKI